MDDFARVAGWAILFLALLNAFAYALLFGNPLVVADGWYFLDTFVRQALDGSLGLADFFAKRGPLDHAQPLRKWILLMELRHFHLDFMPGALLGVLCAGGCSLIVLAVLRCGDEAGSPMWFRYLAWATISALLLSLNSTGIWSWPLVALGYTNYLVVFGFFAVLWRTVRGGHAIWLVLMALLLAVIADDTALLVMMASLLALTVPWWQGQSRRKISRVALAVVLAFALVRLVMAISLPDYSGTPSMSQRLTSLWSVFLDDGWWKWWVLPFANSVIAPQQLQARVSDSVVVIWQVAVAVVLLLGHVVFWWRYMRRPVNGTCYFAAALMLLCYAFVAGILVGRVSAMGSDYLNQPRYVLLYQFQLVALMMMAAGTTWPRPAGRSRQVLGGVLAGLMVLLTCFQYSLSVRSWSIAHYIRAYYVHQAELMVSMGRNPHVLPDNCVPIRPLCKKYSAEQRADLLGLLRENKLNVYSRSFRRMHGLTGVIEEPNP